MTAITHRLLHLRFLRPRHLFYPHHFSSSTSDIPPPQSLPKPSSSSYFSDVRATIQREHPSQKPLRRPLSSPQTPPPSKSNNLEEIRRNLAEYRSRSAAPPPSGQNVSLEELRETNLVRKHDRSATSSNPPAPSFDAIKESLRYLLVDSGSERNQNYSLSGFRENLNASVEPPALVRGSGGLSCFLKKENDRGEDDRSAMRTALIRMCDYSELGSKLKTLRPEKKKGKWFTLVELNERLAKLREIEEKESQARVGGVLWRDLRDTIVKSDASEKKLKNKTMQRLDILDQLGGTPSYLLKDPKDHLVEKYFHPDNMSSAEKLKMELKKVRDEFKMSESDCGSARVQVALLTTKIRHLSTVLHKKDKHSRRGLQAMVQRRKKLLKYLRRTDWDSYCFVLSKLGLRDNPDIKT